MLVSAAAPGLGALALVQSPAPVAFGLRYFEPDLDQQEHIHAVFVAQSCSVELAAPAQVVALTKEGWEMPC